MYYPDLYQPSGVLVDQFGDLDLVATEDGTLVHSIESGSLFDTSSSSSVGYFSPMSRHTTPDSGYMGQHFAAEEAPFVSNPGITVPQVSSFYPPGGFPGNPITVRIRSHQPVELNPGPKPSIIFAGYQLPSQLWPMGVVSGYYEYSVTTTVPEMDVTTSPTHMPLYLSINDATQNTTTPIPIGNFEYWQSAEHEAYSASLEPARGKRRASSAAGLPYQSSIKRMASQTFMEPFTEHEAPPQTQAYDYAPRTQWEHQQGYPSYSSFPATSVAQQQGGAEFQYGSGYDVQFTQAEPYHGAQPTASMPFRTHERDPSATMNPVTSTLPDAPVNVRTSMLRQPTSRPRLIAQSPAPQFNPYSIPKATLEIEGDLDSVTKGWTAQELQERRRIVQFERHQTGSVITASFRVISQAQWEPESISINCIWWQERREAFITSVDLIMLLESIMALRFTLQEKNRIRRNLEGFKPLTVGRSKPDKEPLSEDVEEFFRVIMSLEEPRPRSIEKDVKVFPWSQLGSAMKKVVDKYSASYASTAGTLASTSSSRNVDDSPLATRASHSGDASGRSQSGLRGGGGESRLRSPYSSVPQATMGPLTTMPSEVAPMLSHDMDAYWHMTRGEPGYDISPTTSDAYQVPGFVAPSYPSAAVPQSPLHDRPHGATHGAYSGKGSSKESSKGSSKGSSKESSKGSSKESSKGSSKESSKGSSKESSKGSSKGSSKESGKGEKHRSSRR